MNSRPLFLTRKFPPSVGGMETLALGVWTTLSAERPQATLMAYGRSNIGLIWWLPMSLIRLTVGLARKKSDFVLCGDALMLAVATPLLRVFNVEYATMVMGLDVTHANRLYQRLIRSPLRKCPQIIAISQATAEATLALSVPKDRVSVVRLGVSPPVNRDEEALPRQRLLRQFDLPEGAFVIATLGRLVRRKGISWFTDNVMPFLPSQAHLLVAGTGPEEDEIRRIVGAHGLEGQVHLLGMVSELDKDRIMSQADIFIQPNIRVPGDMEGFGLVTVEAAMRGSLVLASALEGILDAVLDGETGILIDPEDHQEWIARITALTQNPADCSALAAAYSSAARREYSLEEMGRQIYQELGFDRNRPT